MAAIYDYLSSFLSSGNKNSEEKDDSRLKPDKYAKDPNLAWSYRKSKGKETAEKVEPLAIDTPVYDDKVRFLCISDTHTYLERSKDYVIPDGDVLLHAGDLTMYGKPDEVEIVNTFLGEYMITSVYKFNHFSVETTFMLMQTGWIQACRRVTRRLA